MTAVNERTITLEWYQIEQAALVGIKRFTEAKREGLVSRGVVSCQNDIEAAGAELAVSVFLGARWFAGVNTYEEADVYPDIEVRLATATNRNLMIRCDRVHLERPYVLVYGGLPTYKVIGWMRGEDAVRNEWRCNPHSFGEVFLVPVEELHPAEELRTEFRLNGAA